MRVLLQPTPDYWVSLLHKKLVGATVLDARLAHGNRSHVHAFSHCATTPLGGVTVWAVNLLDQRVRVSVRAAWGKAGVDKTDVHQFVLTAAGGDGLHSGRTLLNGELLSLSSSGELPSIQPRIRRLGRVPSMTMPARSIAFWVFPDAQVRPCMDVSHKKVVPKEKVKQENSEEDISEYEPENFKYGHAVEERDSRERYQSPTKVKRKIQYEKNKHGHRDSTSEEHNSAETREILFGTSNKKKNTEHRFADDHYTQRYSLKTKNVGSKSAKDYYNEENNRHILTGRKNTKFSHGSSESDSNESGGKKYKNNIQMKQTNAQDFSESKSKFIKPTNAYPKKYQPKSTGEVEGKLERYRQERKKYEKSESEYIKSEQLNKVKITDYKNNESKNLDSGEDRSKYEQSKKKYVPFEEQIKKNTDEDMHKNSSKHDHIIPINELNNQRHDDAIVQHDDSLSSSSENDSSILTQAEQSRVPDHRPQKTTESKDAKMETERFLKAKFANLNSNSPEATSVAPENVVVMEILHNGMEEGNEEKKSRVVRSISESGPYIIPGLSPDLYQQQPKVKSTSKKRKEDSIRHPWKTKKPKETSKHGKKKDDDHQESIGYDPNKPVSYEDADHLFGSHLSQKTEDDSFPRGDVFLKEAGESQEKDNDYDYVGDEDEKKDHDHTHSEEVTDNEELPSKYHGLGHFFENVRITTPQIKENLINYGELWEAEGYGESEETHICDHDEEDSKVIPNNEPSEELDRKLKNKTANILKSYFDNTRDSKELDMEEEHRKQKMAAKECTDADEEYDIEEDSSETIGSSYPSLQHPHSMPYQHSKQLTHQEITESTPSKGRYRTKRHGEYTDTDIFSNIGDGVGAIVDNALTAGPVITKKLLSNGKTSLVFDKGAEGEERLSKIVDHVVHTIRDFDADFDPKIVSLKLESDYPKEIVKRSVDSKEGNHLSRVHKKQLNSFSEELEQDKENNFKTVNQNTNSNTFISKYNSSQNPTDKGNVFANIDSTKYRNIGASLPTEQSKIESDKIQNKSHGSASQMPIPEYYRNRVLQDKYSAMLSQAQNETKISNNTFDHKKLIRSKRSEMTEETYDADESENLQKKLKKSKLKHLIYEKKLKDAECKKLHEDDKIYKEKGFEKRQKKAKLIKTKGDKKKKIRKLKSKEHAEGHIKKRLLHKKGDKGKKALLKYKRSLFLIDDNDLINSAEERNTLLTPYDVQHGFKLLESEDPYKESTVNGQDFIYFIDKNEPTTGSNERIEIGEEINPKSAVNEVSSLVESGRLQESPVQHSGVIYEFVPEHFLDPTLQQEHEVRVILDPLGNGWEYELTQNEYSVDPGEYSDNIPTLNGQDDNIRTKFNTIGDGLEQLFDETPDTARVFPVARDAEYRIGDIGEYADDFLVHDIGEGSAVNDEDHQQNGMWPYEEVSEFEISGIDEATHNELSKIIGSTMKVLVEMPPPGTFRGSIVGQEAGNENDESENTRNKRSLINGGPYVGSNEWFEEGEIVEERVFKKPYKLDDGLRYKYRDFAKGSDDDLYPNETIIKEIIENEAVNNDILPDPDRDNNVHRENFILRNRELINYAPVSSVINGTVDDSQLNATEEIQTQEDKPGESNIQVDSESAETGHNATATEGVPSKSSDKATTENKPNFFNKIMNSLSKAYSYVRNLVFP